MKNKEAISTPVNSSPTYNQDMFSPTAQCDITVMSSTPASSSVVGRHKHDETITETHLTTDLVGDQTENKNSDTSYHKLDSKVHAHTGDVKLTGSSSSPNCKPDTSEQKCKGLYSNISCNENVSYHDKSDKLEYYGLDEEDVKQFFDYNSANEDDDRMAASVKVTDQLQPNSPTHNDEVVSDHDNSEMDELFANNWSNLTQEQLLEEEQQRLTHSKPIVDHTNSGCGDDVIGNDVMDCVISKDENVTPITTGFCHYTIADAVKPSSSTSNSRSLRNPCKSFKAPRMANNIRRTGCGDDGVTNNLPMSTGRVISCCFTSAGDGKKLTVSAAALQHAVRLVEDCTGDISGVSDIDSHGNCKSNEATDRVEEQEVIMVDISTDTKKELPFGTSTKVVEETKVPSPSCLSVKEVRESSECGEEERLCDTSKESHDSLENYGLENINMEQFSAFTQMPGYVRAAVRSDDYQLTTNVQQISEDTRTTPGGSFNPCPTGRSIYNATPCRQPADGHDDEELKKMFDTQLVKQVLDFNSSNEDDDRMAETNNVSVYQ